MKKLLLLTIFAAIVASVSAQDIIVTRRAGKVAGKVFEITDTHVKYRKAENPTGPLYAIAKSEVTMIEYEDGRTESVSAEVVAPAVTPASSSPVVYGDDSHVVSYKEVHRNTSDSKLRKKYFNLNYASQNMFYDGYESVNSSWGAGFSTGQTYVVHRNPIAGMIHIGIDATWFDINFAHYKGSDNLKLYQGDIAMGLGLGVHVTPIGKLGIHAYARYNPTFATIFYEDGFSGGYASGIVAGGAISWGVISVGAEMRRSYGSYNDWTGDEEVRAKGVKMNTKGVRVYLGFRW